MLTNAVALTRLLLSERPSLLRLAQRIVGTAPAAEDVTQSLWLRIQRVEDDPPIANKRAYLYRLATNLAVDHVRSDQRREDVHAEAHALLWGSDASLTPERIVDSLATLRRVKAAAETLPEPTRSIFRMNRIEGLTQRDIAAKVGLTTTSIENHIRRALTALGRARDGNESSE